VTFQRALACTAAIAGIVTGIQAGGTITPRTDPFAFFQPDVVVGAADRERLDHGDVVVRVLPSRDGQLGVFVSSGLDAPAEALVTWTRAIAELKQGKFVLAVRRFSDPPAIEDLDGLALDEGDVEAVRRCRIGDCGIKLGGVEIESLRAAGAGPEWRAAIQQEFRRAVLNRVSAYRSDGLAGLPAYADRRDALRPEDAFAAILAGSPYLRDRLPGVSARLLDYPNADEPGVESFFYWSKEQYGTGKRVISVTHVDIVRPDAADAPAVLVLGKEIFATHYRTGSLGVTAVVHDPVTDRRYLVYINRSHVDVLHGLFGGLKRKLIEGRLADESTELVRAVRRKLESGVPAPPPRPIQEGEI
jgi:hypothetical protein